MNINWRLITFIEILTPVELRVFLRIYMIYCFTVGELAGVFPEKKN